ncbi:MAG: T9SS type A sorting domain-containing protein [Saprospiraceae bacterium]
MCRNYSKSFLRRTLLAIVFFNIVFINLLSATQIKNSNQFLIRDKNNHANLGQYNNIDGLEVGFECTSEQVRFCIWNPTKLRIGEFELSIIEDDVILFIKKYTLNPRDTINLNFPDNGNVYKVKIVLLNILPSLAPLVKTFNSCKENNVIFLKRNVANTMEEEHSEEIKSVPNNEQDKEKPVNAFNAKSFNVARVNVVGNELTVATRSIEDDVTVLWSVFDLSGRILKQGKVSLNLGDNILNMNLKDITTGFYILVIQSNLESYKTNFKIIN